MAMGLLLAGCCLRAESLEVASLVPAISATNLEEAIDIMTKETALQIAREECARRGWVWNEQTSVKWGFFSYTVWGGGQKGGNLCMRIRKKDGAVISATM